MKKTILAITISASILGVVGTSQACSRLAIDTGENGVIQVRTLDWDTPLGTVAVVHPAGEKNRVNITDGKYKNNAKWTTKYTTVAFEEADFFHKAVPSARNVEGLMIDTLYQSSSYPFLNEHISKDTGKTTIGPGQITHYLAENYKNVSEVIDAFNKGEFDIAWGQLLVGESGQHGFHVAGTDPTGDTVLFQLDLKGETVMYTGNINDSDLGVQANEPLLPEQRMYSKTFGDFKDVEYGNRIPGGIASKDRYARLSWMNAYHNKESYKGKSFYQALVAINGAFDQAANLAQFIPVGSNIMTQTSDRALKAQGRETQENNPSGTYPSRIKYTHALGNGYVEMADLDTYRQISFNMDEVSKFTKPMCADMAKQANASKTKVEFKECGGDLVQLGK